MHQLGVMWLIWALGTAATVVVAAHKQRGLLTWFVLGAILGMVAVGILMILPPVYPKSTDIPATAEDKFDRLPSTSLLANFAEQGVQTLGPAAVFGFVSYEIWSMKAALIAAAATVGFFAIWNYLYRKDWTLKAEAAKNPLLAACQGQYDCGLLTVAPVRGSRVTRGGFVIDLKRQTLFLCAGNAVKSYDASQIREWLVPRWQAPTRMKAVGGSLSSKQRMNADLEFEYQKAFNRSLRNNLIQIRVADLDHPEWWLWCPPRHEARLGEMLQRLSD